MCLYVFFYWLMMDSIQWKWQGVNCMISFGFFLLLMCGKGANLAEMTNLGLPVPQGFTITTEACTQYYEDGKKINDEIKGQIMEYIGKMEEITGKKFGDK